MTSPEVSFGVVLTRGEDRAARALRSIAEQDVAGEVLLVLNDADEEMRALAHSVAGARILHDGIDLGIVFAWNLALQAARAPAFCTVHEDVVLGQGCLRRLLQTLHERPDAGAVSPLLELPGGQRQAGGCLWSDGANTRLSAEAGEPVRAVDQAASACLLLRRSALLAVGGFSERSFPSVYVDTRASTQLWASGWTVLADPRARAAHETGAMLDPRRGPRHGERFRRFLLERHRQRYCDDWATWLSGLADRDDPMDASHPSEHELAAARARTRDREQAALAAGPPSTSRSALELPADLERHVRTLRECLVDELLEELMAGETAREREVIEVHRIVEQQQLELERLHALAAEQHAELQRVHAAYAELWAARERLLAAEGPS